MASFNMQEFHEILEKCKDRSQQEKQDQVRFLIVIINQLVFNKYLLKTNFKCHFINDSFVLFLDFTSAVPLY